MPWLAISPGTLTWPGSSVWGEIVDLGELDVGCELPPFQADQLTLGQPAEAWLDGEETQAAKGSVALIGYSSPKSRSSRSNVARTRGSRTL